MRGIRLIVSFVLVLFLFTPVVEATTPKTPTISALSNKDTTIRGTAEKNTTVYARARGKQIGKVVTSSKGTYIIKIKALSASTKVYVYSQNKSGVKSKSATKIVTDRIAPKAPTILKVDYKASTLKGKTEVNANVHLHFPNKKIVKVKANTKGEFQIKVPSIKTKQSLTIYAYDASKNCSKAKKYTIDYEKYIAREIVNAVNKERKSAGLPALKIETKVENIAMLKAKDMAVNGYFSHKSPTYGSAFDMLKKEKITYNRAGENIAYGYATPADVMKGWMNSSGHRANILQKDYTHIGVGYVQNGHYWVQVFISR